MAKSAKLWSVVSAVQLKSVGKSYAEEGDRVDEERYQFEGWAQSESIGER